MTGPLAGQIARIQSDEAQRDTQEQLRRFNIAAGTAVGELVRTTLGPQGMDKLLVDSGGMGIVTNNGASILRESIDHPVGDLIADIATTQEDEVGDGTTTTAIIAGQLLAEAETLLEQGVHPATITRGYTTASELALGVLEDRTISVDPQDEELLMNVARTAMTGRGAEDVGDLLASLVVEATRSVADDRGVDDENIQVIKITGGRIQDSHFLDGVVLEKDRIHPEMPLAVEDATVLLVDPNIEVSALDVENEATITEPDGFRQLVDREQAEMEALVEGLVDRGIDVVICKQHIGDLARKIMAREGIYAAQYVEEEELKRVARATGAAIVSDPRDVDPDDLGTAGQVTETDLDGELKTVVEDGGAAKAVSLLLRGASMNVLDELDRALEDGIAATAAVLEEGRVLPGGGAAETEVALALREAAPTTGTREALAIEAFAEAIEAIPRTLAENAGASSIDGLVEMKAAHDGGATNAGVDDLTGEPVDMLEAGILEPLVVKRRAIQHATDAAVTVLRVDDILATSGEALTELDKKASVPVENMPDQRLGALEREQLAQQGDLDPTEGFDPDAGPV